ncbi:hypothetical protein [Ekhidna sp.]
MGKFQLPKSRNMGGPWLLSGNDLESLDSVINSIDSLLYKSWEQQVRENLSEESGDVEEEYSNKQVAEKFDALQKKGYKACTFINKDDSRLTDESIQGLLKDPASINLKVEEIRIQIVYEKYRENRFIFKLDGINDEMSYELECSDVSVREEIQYEIEKWIAVKRPNKFLRFWSNSAAVMILLAVLSMLIFGSSAYESEEVPYSSELKREAFELLDNGIDSTNSDRVLELLLQYESGYVPSDYVGARSESNPSTKKFFYLSIFVFIIGVVKPKSTI